MKPTLESLDLSPDERRAAEGAVRAIAYAKWLKSGRPEGDHPEFWLEAEREWIENSYVPDRSSDHGATNESEASTVDPTLVGSH